MSLPQTIEELSRLDLSFIQESWSEGMIRDGMRAIIRAKENLKTREIDVWKYLHDYTPPEGQGFMLCDNEIVSKIRNNMETEHSGSSFGWTMRNLEFISKNGLEAYRQRF